MPELMKSFIIINTIQHSMSCYYCIYRCHALSNPLARFGSCCALGLSYLTAHEFQRASKLLLSPLFHSLDSCKEMAPEHARFFMFILHIHRNKDDGSVTFPRLSIHRCQCPERVLDIVGRNPCVSMSTRLHVVVFNHLKYVPCNSLLKRLFTPWTMHSSQGLVTYVIGC